MSRQPLAEDRASLGRMTPRREQSGNGSLGSLVRTAMCSLARRYEFLAARPVGAGIVVAVVAFVLATAASVAHRFPPPSVHDEFSYLLGAETFVNGRLSNPTHPMGRYFETFHELQRPTYASKFPPANALFIASGWVLTGQPIVGVWISFAFMSAALYWMLHAWVGARPGLGLALAFASRAATSYWSYTFWGGAVAAGAGRLGLGASYRIVQSRGGVGNAIVLGLGLLVLANRRPYEGLLLGLAIAVVLARWFWRDRREPWRRKSVCVMLPLTIVGAAGLLCMGIYDKAVTGDWHELPYQAYQHTRDSVPAFVWQRLPHIAPHADRTIRSFDAWQDSIARVARTPSGRLEYLVGVKDFFEFVLPLKLLFPLLLLPLAWRRYWFRFSVLTVGWVVCGMGLTSYFQFHYAAPLVGLILVIYGECLRWLSRLRVGHHTIGRALAAATVVLFFLSGIGSTAEELVRPLPSKQMSRAAQRQLIADTLSHGGRRNLVVVRYGEQHSPLDEWVFNSADINGSLVVWARDMGDPGNNPLLDYFRGRAAWLVEVNSDSGPYRVRPYVPRTP